MPRQVLLDLGTIPFHLGARDVPDNKPFPDSLRFVAGATCDGRLVQMPDEDVSAHLADAYRAGSQVGTPMGSSQLGLLTAQDFLGFLREVAAEEELQGMRVLEVGCGAGHLLKELAGLGADVTGIEPSASSIALEPDVSEFILPTILEDVDLDDKFDVIVHYAVLEHSGDPLDFVGLQATLLKDAGLLVFAVPDCGAHIDRGDISMFLHEHWSYFTKSSLSKLAASLGLSVRACRNASVGGAIYCAWSRESAAERDEAAERVDLRSFPDRARTGLEAVGAFVSEACLDRSRSLGIYCPARFINYHRMLALPSEGLRFFDDDPNLHGKYYPPIAISVESRDALIALPVDELLIMSRSFGKKMADELGRLDQLSRVKMTLIEDLF